MGNLDMYQLLGVIANFVILASNIIVFAAVYRVMPIVRHSCLPLLALSSVLGFLSGGLFIAMEIPIITPDVLQYIFVASCICAIVGSITFAIGGWQLLHWIPELLELRVLDQRDEPFHQPPSGS